MAKTDNSLVLPDGLRRRPFSLADASAAWGVSSRAAWWRLNKLARAGKLVRHARSLYAPPGISAPQPSDRARSVLDAIAGLGNYRAAITGLDVLAPYLHYLPARYPSLLLVEPRAVDDMRTTLSRANFLVVTPSGIADAWRGAPSRTPVVVLKKNARWFGIPSADRVASQERAFLDLLIVVRHDGYPFPSADLAAMWAAFSPAMRQRIARLGRLMEYRPFYDPTRSEPQVPSGLRVGA